MIKPLFYVTLVLLFISPPVKSQLVATDTSFIQDAFKNAENEYTHRILFQSFIYNGNEYVDYDIKINGDPFFEDEYYTLGTLTFDGNYFDSINMKYDIYKQLLVLRYYDYRGYKKDIILPTNKIQEFNLYGHHFIHIRDTFRSTVIEPGIYDLLYQQGFSILSKRRKIYEEKLDGRELKKNFYLKDQFFIYKDGQIFMVKNKRSCLKVFDDKKKELQKYIRKGFLDFNNDFENSLLSIAKFYNSLTQ